MTENATQTVVEHGEASSLPETSWMFRRLLIFLVALAAVGCVFWVLGRVSDITTLRMIAKYSQALQAFCLFLYITGASATDCVRLVSAVRTTRKETVTSAPPPATISAEGDLKTGTATQTTKPATQPVDAPPWERK